MWYEQFDPPTYRLEQDRRPRLGGAKGLKFHGTYLTIYFSLKLVDQQAITAVEGALSSGREADLKAALRNLKPTPAGSRHVEAITFTTQKAMAGYRPPNIGSVVDHQPTDGGLGQPVHYFFLHLAILLTDGDAQEVQRLLEQGDDSAAKALKELLEKNGYLTDTATKAQVEAITFG